MVRLGVLLSALLLTGCVDRRFVIESTPPGAQVLRNGQLVGFTPADDHFVYNGVYEFTLIKDGYETLHVKEKIRPPWYEIPGLDFFTENIVPYRFRDVRRLHFQMQPLRQVPPDEVLQHATPLREQARQIGDPGPLPPEPVPVRAPVVGGGG
jgi:PEGA domain